MARQAQGREHEAFFKQLKLMPNTDGGSEMTAWFGVPFSQVGAQVRLSQCSQAAESCKSLLEMVCYNSFAPWSYSFLKNTPYV